MSSSDKEQSELLNDGSALDDDTGVRCIDLLADERSR